MSLIIGRIYAWKSNDELVRIFSGGGRYYSGRGCTLRTAVPYNHIRPEDVYEPNIKQINSFLEQEMENGMTQTTNNRLTIKKIPV